MAEFFDDDATWDLNAPDPEDQLIAHCIDLIVRGFRPDEVIQEIQRTRGTTITRGDLNRWIEAAVDSGEDIPLNLDTRSLRKRRASIFATLDKAIGHFEAEMHGLMSTQRAARDKVNVNLMLDRTPVELGSTDTGKVISTKATLLSPVDAMKVYTATSDELVKLGGELMRAFETLDAMIDAATPEAAREAEATRMLPAASPPDIIIEQVAEPGTRQASLKRRMS